MTSFEKSASAQIRNYLFVSAEVIESCQVFENELIAVSLELANVFLKGGKLLVSGNGGSCADSQHIAGELISKYKKERKGLPVLSLPTSLPTLTAASNDFDYTQAVAREVDAFGQKGDVFWVLSTSGNSKNLLESIAIARAKGMKVIGFTGKSGGDMGDYCDVLFNVDSDETPIIQQAHYVMAHLICDLVEQKMPERNYLPDVKKVKTKTSLKKVLNRLKKTK